MLYLGTGRRSLRLRAAEPARLLLLGGEPFDEQIVMWWNFVGRTGEEIADYADAVERRSRDRFGAVVGLRRRPARGAAAAAGAAAGPRPGAVSA